MDVNTARIRRVDRPEEDTILVAVDRLRHCPSEVPDAFWPLTKQRGKKKDKVPNPLLTGDARLITQNREQDTDSPPGGSSDDGGPPVDSDREAVLSQQAVGDSDSELSSQPARPAGERNEPPKRDDRPEQSITKSSEKTSLDGGLTDATGPVKPRGGKWAHRLRKNPKKYSPEDD